MGRIQVLESEAKLVEKARHAFEEYAAKNDEDFAGMDTLRVYQIRLIRWQTKNFGAQPWHVFAHGMCEEGCWEYIEAEETQNQQEMYDALGDVFIYACNACSLLRLDFQTLVEDFAPSHPDSAIFDHTKPLVKAIGAINHVVLKNFQGIRGYDDVEQARRHLGAMLFRALRAARTLAFLGDWDPSVLFYNVADMVLKRDFTKSAVNG